MSVEQNKETLRRGAEAFNNRGHRSGWLAIHHPAVTAYGLGPQPV